MAEHHMEIKFHHNSRPILVRIEIPKSVRGSKDVGAIISYLSRIAATAITDAGTQMQAQEKGRKK